MDPLTSDLRPSHLLWETIAGRGSPRRARAVVELNWGKAPKTCQAMVAMVLSSQEDVSGSCTVSIVHGRHSGGEALFVTPRVLDSLGDEHNDTLDYELGEVLFCFEAKGCCEHADADCSEVAWIYHLPAQPRRWISKIGTGPVGPGGEQGRDPTNKTGPWETTDVRLNRWGKIVYVVGISVISTVWE